MPQRAWRGAVVQSYANLQYFIAQSDSINQVLSRKDNPCNRSFNPLNPKLSFTWQICQITSFPFRYITKIALQIIAGIAWILGCEGAKKSLHEKARFFETGFNVYSENSTQLFLIKKSINNFDKEGRVVAKTPAIPPSAITDPKIKKRTFYDGIKFNNNKGICRGMSEWFAYLYLNTKDQFSDPRAHMRALGKQFVNGGGLDPALFQSIDLKKGKLLRLKVGVQPPHAAETPLHQIATAQWHSSKRDMVAKLQSLPPGVYKTGVPRHATAYVKIHNNLGFFFDPNVGIVEINGPAHAEQFYELLSTTQKEIGDLPSTLGFMNTIRISPVVKR